MRGNLGWKEPMRRHDSEPDERGNLKSRLAYTESAEGAPRAKPAVPAEEVQDSLNATV
jgi:hypothetical protein